MERPPIPQIPGDNRTRPYNGIAIQRAAILDRLTIGPATCEQLQSECQAPDPRARIHELRKEGHDIATHDQDRFNRDGSVNSVGLYVLLTKDQRQAALFEPP